MTRFCGVVALLVVAGHAGAQVDDDTRARSHFEAGVSYYEQSRYAEAGHEFEEAYRLSHRAGLLVNASRAYERGELLADAVRVLDAYLAQHDDESDRATQEGRRQALADRLASHTAHPAEEPTHTGEPPRPRPPPSSAGLGPLGFASIIGGGVVVVLGAIVLGTSLAAEDSYGQLTRTCGLDHSACPPGSAAQIASGAELADLSTVLTFVGIGVAVASLVCLGLELAGVGHASDARARLRFVPGPGQAGLALRWVL